MGLKVPGVSWPLTAAGNLLMGTNRVTFSDVGLVRGAAGRLDVDDGAGGTGHLFVRGGPITITDVTLTRQASGAVGLGLNGIAKAVGSLFIVGANTRFGFGAVAAIDNTVDTAMSRRAAGRMGVETGVAGTLADLEAAFLWHPNETAPGAAVATLNNAPAGAAGDPNKWLQVKDSAGTVHVIPAWTP